MNRSWSREATAKAVPIAVAIGLLWASAMTVRAEPAPSQRAAGDGAAPSVPQLPSSAAALPSAGPSAAAVSTVPTPGPASSEDIRDIRGPRPIASSWLVWGLIGAGALAVLASLLWRWIRRRRRAPEPQDFEAALAKLNAARALMQPGRGREFSIEVSGVVREYIERRFRVMAAHRTTHEFLHDLILSADPGLAAQRDLLGEFLQSCDLAKFGGWNLRTDQMEAMLESARRFIQSAAADPRAAPGDVPSGQPRDGAAAGAGIPSSSSDGKSHVSVPSA